MDNDKIQIIDKELMTRFQAQRAEARDCFNRAAESYAQGFLKLAQIRLERSYLAEYNRWDDFLEAFKHEVSDASRSQITDMERAVRRLRSLTDAKGNKIWSDDEILEALEHPMVIREALKKCGEWSWGGGFIKLAEKVDPPLLLEPATDAEVLTDILRNAIALPTGEGRKYISERAGEPQIYAVLRGFANVTAIEIVYEDLTRYEFICKGAVPTVIKEWLESRLRARFNDEE